MRILETCLRELGSDGTVIASDITLTSAAMQASRGSILVPSVRDPQCLARILQTVDDERIALIVPTIDPELPFYAEHADAFARRQCQINISSPQTVQIGFDKALTHAFLTQHGIPTVQQWDLPQAIARASRLPFPVVAKPRRGSGSIGLARVHSPDGLLALPATIDMIVQSTAPGREYTVDLFIDQHGECRCAVPRLRLETRGGEVSKGVTVRNRAVLSAARLVAQSLPGARGVINVQVFHDETSGQTNVIEINPRFGGGYPLTHQAGAPMARWLLEEALGLPCSAQDDLWQEGVVMLRFDDAVFVSATDAGVALPAPGRRE